MFRIAYADKTVADDLKNLRVHERKRILDSVERQLRHEPAVKTRHRRPIIGGSSPIWLRVTTQTSWNSCGLSNPDVRRSPYSIFFFFAGQRERSKKKGQPKAFAGTVCGSLRCFFETRFPILGNLRHRKNDAPLAGRSNGSSFRATEHAVQTGQQDLTVADMTKLASLPQPTLQLP